MTKDKNNIQRMLKDNRVVLILAMISCFLWGSAFPSIKKGYELFNISNSDTYGQILFAGLRFTLSGIMVFIVCLIFKYSVKIKKNQLLLLVSLGILQTTLQYYFFYIGLSNISGSTGSILSSLGTFFSVIFAPVFFKEDKFTLKKAIGIIIGFLGIFILNYDGIVSHTFSFRGEGFIIISSILSALANIYTKKLTKINISSFAISAYQLFIGGIILTNIGFILSKGKIINFTPESTILLIYMGFISAAAFSIWTVLLKHNDVSVVSINKFTIPLFGTFLSFIFLNERNINANVVIAVAFVTFGIFIVNTRQRY